MRGDTVGAFNGRQYTVSTSATRKREEGKEGRELGGEVHYRIKKGSNVKSIKGRKGSAALPDSLKEIRMCVQEEVCAAQKPVGRENKGMRRRERRKQPEEFVVDLQPLIYRGALRQLSGTVISATSAQVAQPELRSRCQNRFHIMKQGSMTSVCRCQGKGAIGQACS